MNRILKNIAKLLIISLALILVSVLGASSWEFTIPPNAIFGLDGSFKIGNTSVNSTAIVADNFNTNEGYSYLIYTSGTTIYVKNGTTGKVDYRGTNATTAFQTALNIGGNIFFRGNYVVKQLTITNLNNIRIQGMSNSSLTLNDSSDSILFKLIGTIDNIEIDHITAFGDGINTWHQMFVAEDSGQTITNIKVHDNNISRFNVGISFNADLAGKIDNGWIDGNLINVPLGTSSGQGYGIHLANASNIYVNRNTIIGAQRHSIYQGKGDNVNVEISNNIIRNHRINVCDASYRPAIVISRSSFVSVNSNEFYNGCDASIEVSGDTGQSFNANIVTIQNNLIMYRANLVPDIFIGEQTTLTSYNTNNVLVSGNKIISNDTNGNPNIVLLNGKNISIIYNEITRLQSPKGFSQFIEVGNSLYVKKIGDISDIIVKGNILKGSGQDLHGIYVDSAVTNGSITKGALKIYDNEFDDGITTRVRLAALITNPNIWINSARVFQSSSIPRTGYWQIGDIIYNSSPSSGNPIGWMNTAAGNPGTWRPMTNLT